MAKRTSDEQAQRRNGRMIAKMLCAETTQEAIDAINECYAEIGNAFEEKYEAYIMKGVARAAKVATTSKEAMELFQFLRCGNCLQSLEEEQLAFRRALELCQYKEDVEDDVMGYFYSNFPDLEDRFYFIELFERGNNLNYRPKEK